MRLIKVIQRNPMVKSILVLASVAVICILATVIVLTIPTDIGAPYEAFEANDSYLFDPLELSLGRMHVSYPEGGVLVGVYRRNELTALVILAEGTVHYLTEEDETSLVVEQMILHMHPSEIALVRGQSYIEASVLPDAILEAQMLLAATAGGEPTLEVFGVKKVFLPRPGVARVELFGEGLHHSYIHARQTILSGPMLNDYVLDMNAPMYPPKDQFVFSLTVILVMVLAVAIGLIFVTPDYKPIIRHRIPASRLIWPLLLLCLHFAVEIYLTRLTLSPLVTWGWRVMVIAAALWVADTHGEGLAFLGLRPAKFWSGIGTGILTGFLLFICGSIALPGGIVPVDYGELLSNYGVALTTVILFHELLWRGLIQGSFRRRFPALVSILITTVLFSLSSYLPFYLSGAYTTETLLTSFFIAPMTALILGFAYERTGSLFTPMATLSVLYLLPQILHF